MGGVRKKGGRGSGGWVTGQPLVCCQVAEISAKKLKRGWRKKSWLEEFVAEFCRKGAKEILERISFLADLFSSTGQKIFLGPGNTGSSILYTRQQLSAVRFISQIRKDDLCLPF